MKSTLLTLGTVFTMSITFFGCGETIDDTALEPSRETRVQGIADTACDRFEECGLIGSESDDTYATMSECKSDMEKEFYALWPADECDDGRMNDSQYQVCDQRAETYACDQGLFEFITYYQQCKSDKVCTDPRNK